MTLPDRIETVEAQSIEEYAASLIESLDEVDAHMNEVQVRIHEVQLELRRRRSELADRALRLRAAQDDKVVERYNEVHQLGISGGLDLDAPDMLEKRFASRRD